MQNKADIIPFVPGHLEEVAISPGKITGRGWMFDPEQVYHSILVWRNGKLAGAAKMTRREDVAAVYPWINHAGRSGFAWSIRLPEDAGDEVHRIDLLACQAARPIARLSLFVSAASLAAPIPPAKFLERTIGNSSSAYYKGTGLQLWAQLHEYISHGCDFASVKRLLDWGCGGGRLSGPFLTMPGGPEIFGCDVDVEAVDWCAGNLPHGRFTNIALSPPTPYEDGQFDAVIASSVFTHLERDAQIAWLQEMRRIIVPGGILVATVHGPFATRVSHPHRHEQIQRDGFWDDASDAGLDEGSAADCYRSVYQTPQYTRERWAPYFDILEYTPWAVGNQDVVVMRRPR